LAFASWAMKALRATLWLNSGYVKRRATQPGPRRSSPRSLTCLSRRKTRMRPSGTTTRCTACRERPPQSERRPSPASQMFCSRPPASPSVSDPATSLCIGTSPPWIPTPATSTGFSRCCLIPNRRARAWPIRKGFPSRTSIGRALQISSASSTVSFRNRPKGPPCTRA